MAELIINIYIRYNGLYKDIEYIFDPLLKSFILFLLQRSRSILHSSFKVFYLDNEINNNNYIMK